MVECMLIMHLHVRYNVILFLFKITITVESQFPRDECEPAVTGKV